METPERFARGELEAFEELFRQFQAEVYGWIVRIVRDRAAAEDLTVETFWRIWRARARFDPSRSFAAWARRIATNAAVDHLKAARREEPLPDNLAARPAADAAVEEELHEQIRRAFGKLPANLRATATLALVEEQPYEEIARAMGVSVGGVKSRVFRAVRRLRKELERMGVRA